MMDSTTTFRISRVLRCDSGTISYLMWSLNHILSRHFTLISCYSIYEEIISKISYFSFALWDQEECAINAKVATSVNSDPTKLKIAIPSQLPVYYILV